MSDGHGEEVERLQEAFKRDLTAWVLEAATGQVGEAAKRLFITMKRLCEADVGFALGVDQLVERANATGRLEADPGSLEDDIRRRIFEMIGLARIAYEANPDAGAATLGEVLSLGEAEIRRQVDEDTSGT
jgi:hypothetical protein